MIIKQGLLLCILITAFVVLNTDAKTFYIDPASGNLSNNGSQAHPWKTLQEVIDSNKIQTRAYATNPYLLGDTLKVMNQGAPVNAGDTLLLNSGYHGDISIQAALNADYITIAAASGQLPCVNHLLLSGASKWRIQGLTVSAAFDTQGHNRDLLYINSAGWAGPSREITVQNCSLYTVKDASVWTMNEWANYTCTGARLHGSNFIFQNNVVSNVDIGIRIVADSCLVEKNIFQNFSSCGMRLCGASNCSLIHNLVQGFHMVNNVYGMGFQGYSQDSEGTVGAGVVSHDSVFGNTIINTVTPNQPFEGQMYGIACFDGKYDDWTVENNVVLANTWYGIAFDGAQDCRIINNTVYRWDTSNCILPCITVDNYSDGSKSTDCVLRNNFCGTIVNNGDTSCRDDHNITSCNPDSFFVNYGQEDFQLKPGCAAIDNGSPDLAPTTDIAGTPRPQGKGIDIGAYEYVIATATMRPLGDPVGAQTPTLIVGYNRSNRSLYAYVKASGAAGLGNEMKGYFFSVYDIHGRQCGVTNHSGKFSTDWKGTNSENGFSPGVYVVSARSGSSSISSRAIVW
jgi:parallel beta-helix repeat protein